MATRLRWLGHSTLWIESDGKTILVDPFLTGNPAAPVSADDLSPDLILISHGHDDHLGDVLSLAKRTSARSSATTRSASGSPRRASPTSTAASTAARRGSSAARSRSS